MLGDYSALPSDPMFLDRSAVPQAGGVSAPQEEEGTLVSEVFTAWKRERKPNPKTLSEWNAAFRILFEVVGDKPIKKVTKGDIRSFKDTVARLPASSAVKYRGLTVLEVLAEVGDDPTVIRLAGPSVNKLLTALGSVFSWAVDNGYAEVNPTTKVRVRVRAAQTPTRLPYSGDDLRTIFSWPIFTGAASKARRKAPGPNVYRHAHFWLPLLGLFTGARLEEIAQALVDDIREVNGVMVLDINAEGGKTVKAAASVRLVPLHPEVIQCGFLEYVEKLKRDGQARLLPDLKQDTMGKWSGNWSKWWSRYQRAMGITDKRKVFHSCRHSFRDALREARVSEDVADALMGHANQSMGGRYGRGFSVDVLAEAINKIAYEGLDLGHLYTD